MSKPTYQNKAKSTWPAFVSRKAKKQAMVPFSINMAEGDTDLVITELCDAVELLKNCINGIDFPKQINGNQMVKKQIKSIIKLINEQKKSLKYNLTQYKKELREFERS